MIKVYCDSGGYRSELKMMNDGGRILLAMFPYENRNKKIHDFGLPSGARWNDMGNVSWDDLSGYSWDDFEGSEKFNDVLKLVGDGNRKDAMHLDSAYKNKCQMFLTRDKHHILSKKKEIKSLLGIDIYHSDDDWEVFCDFLKRLEDK